MRLYIDPGTGSMLFAIVIALVGLLFYLIRGLIIKIRFMVSAGKLDKANLNTIPLVIFAEDKRYWQVFEPICRELDSRGFNVVYMTSSQDDPALKNEFKHVDAKFIGEGNKAFAKLGFLNATILLSTTPGLDVYQWKRSQDVKWYVHIRHDPCPSTLMYEFFGIDYYDAILYSGIHQEGEVRCLEKLRNLPEKEMVRVGIPYMDSKYEKIKDIPKVASDKRTILVAPSWGSNSIFNRMGSKALKELVKTGYHIIIRPHPQSYISEKPMLDELMKEFPESEQIEWNRDADNTEVSMRVDLLISDFSGIVYEFAFLYDKPVICAMSDFDNSAKDCWWVDLPPLTVDCLSELGAILTEENLSDLKKMIDDAIDDDSHTEKRQKLSEETWAYRGEGAKRTADYLIKKYEELKPKESANSLKNRKAKKVKAKKA